MGIAPSGEEPLPYPIRANPCPGAQHLLGGRAACGPRDGSVVRGRRLACVEVRGGVGGGRRYHLQCSDTLDCEYLHIFVMHECQSDEGIEASCNSLRMLGTGYKRLH